jgi:hypothetical protein
MGGDSQEDEFTRPRVNPFQALFARMSTTCECAFVPASHLPQAILRSII